MVQNTACRGASLFCVLFSCLHLCASEVTWSPPVAAGDGHVVPEISVEAQRCGNPLPDVGGVLLQKSSSRIHHLNQGVVAEIVHRVVPEIAIQTALENATSFENASSIAPVALNRSLAVVVDEGQQKSEEKTRASVYIGEDQVRTRFLKDRDWLQRVGVGLVFVSLLVLSFVCLIVNCMKRPQEEMRERHENFDPWLSPRQVDGRKLYQAPRIPAPVDTSRLPALSSHALFPPVDSLPSSHSTLRSLPQFGPSFPSHLQFGPSQLRQVEHPGSAANSQRSMQVPDPRFGSHCSVLSSQQTLQHLQQRQSIESQQPMLLRPGNGSPPLLGAVMYQDSPAQSPRYSTAAITPRFSTPPNSTSPRMRPQSSSTIATEQQVAMWRAEIQARVAAATGEEVARRKIMARGGLLGGDGRQEMAGWPRGRDQGGDGRVAAGAKPTRSLSPNEDNRLVPQLPLRARTTSPQGQPQHDSFHDEAGHLRTFDEGLSTPTFEDFPRLAKEGVSGLKSFYNEQRMKFQGLHKK